MKATYTSEYNVYEEVDIKNEWNYSNAEEREEKRLTRVIYRKFLSVWLPGRWRIQLVRRY